MPEHKGHKAESDVEPEAHESRSRAAEGGEGGSYERDGAGSDDTPAKRAPKRAVNNRVDPGPTGVATLSRRRESKSRRLGCGSRPLERAHRRLQLGCGLVRDLLQSPRLACHLDHDLRIHRLDEDRVASGGRVGSYYDVARQ